MQHLYILLLALAVSPLQSNAQSNVRKKIHNGQIGDEWVRKPIGTKKNIGNPPKHLKNVRNTREKLRNDKPSKMRAK